MKILARIIFSLWLMLVPMNVVSMEQKNKDCGLCDSSDQQSMVPYKGESYHQGCLIRQASFERKCPQDGSPLSVDVVCALLKEESSTGK